MDAVTHPTLESVDAAILDRLAADPVRNTVALTSLDRIRRLGPTELKPTLITFHTNGQVVGSLIRTPPWSVQTADMPLDALDLAISVVREVDPDITAVTGPREKSEAFATAWSETFHVTLASRLYRLDTLTTPSVEGARRLANEADITLLGTWRDAFTAEAVPGAPVQSGTEILRSSLQLGNGHAIWESNNIPVAWAAGNLPISGMTRVGPVYTPPNHRRHGYGAAATAAITQWALDNGATDVLLFADLTNPTSNSIYQRIGYQPVEDWTEYSWKR